jgi:oligopeptide/dipeptide ABC transporter ATP-binding protein
MSSEAKPLLEIRGLVKEFRGAAGNPLRAVKGVDLDVYPGETLGLVGESGCGKSTLARCALRLLEPDSGRIRFDGIDLNGLTPADLRRKRREFQMVFQDPAASLDPRMTVGQILAEPFDIHNLGNRAEREARVHELLSLVVLEGSLVSRKPAALSGGQQQRVGIARALALKPRLIVADEPVSALDASVQAQILNLLIDLQKRFNLTLVLIAHSLAVVHYLCTRVVVMYLGRIVEEAEAADFFREPRHPYSRLLLGSMPSLELANSQPESAGGDMPSPLNPPAGCAFHTRCPQVLPRCSGEIPVLQMTDGGGKTACFLCTS